jgi:hypothetical protein
MQPMQIHLPEPLNELAQTLYFGTRTRYATMTDVSFVSDTRIVAAHRYGRKLHVIDIDLPTGSHTIISSYDLHAMQEGIHQPEMLEIVGNQVFMICYSPMLFIFDLSSSGILTKVASFQLNSVRTPYHGIQHHNGFLYLTPSNKSHGDDRIVKFKIADNSIDYAKSFGIRIKDIGFCESGDVILIGNYKGKKAMIDPGSTFNATIRVCNSQFEETDRREFPLTHFDAVAVRGNDFYATASDMEGGWIYCGTVKDGKIETLDKQGVSDFPHGINILGDILAYTSYATSSIYLSRLNIK